jgi:hypothetical protein
MPILKLTTDIGFMEIDQRVDTKVNTYYLESVCKG